jgi:hypothetical protein
MARIENRTAKGKFQKAGNKAITGPLRTLIVVSVNRQKNVRQKNKNAIFLPYIFLSV